MANDSLGDRMKDYEKCYRTMLPNRSNVIIRLDGRAFHTLTRGMKKPYDKNFLRSMRFVARKLMEEIQNVKMVYVQSDEISIWMNNDQTIDTQAYFANSLNKILSLTASYATATFCKHTELFGMFDSRAFILPDKIEITNYFLWRMKDWYRNSVSMLARSLYSAKELEFKSLPEQFDMIYAKGESWEKQLEQFKNGSLFIKKERMVVEIFGKHDFQKLFEVVNNL